MQKYNFFICFGLSLLVGLFIQIPETHAQGIRNGYEIRGLKDGDFARAMRTIAERASELSFDGQKGFIGFTIKGALIFGNEIGGMTPEQFGTLDRRSGPLVLPYEYSRAFTPEGQKKFSVSAFGFRNMNDYSAKDDSVVNVDGGFALINTLDFLTFTYDENHTYSNLKTFDLKFITIEPRIGVLYSEDKNYYLKLKASVDLGIGKGSFVQPDGSSVAMGSPRKRKDNGIISQMRNSPGFRFNYSAGIEYNKITDRGGDFNLQANWKYGYHRAHFNDTNQMTANQNTRKQYEADYAQYQNDLTQFSVVKYNADLKDYNARKGAYYGTNHPYQFPDDEYARATGDVHPWQPQEPIEPKYASTIARAPRTYGLFSTSLSYSKIINQKRLNANQQTSPDLKNAKNPIRLGFEIEWNLLVHDQFKNLPDGKYDFQFKDNFNRQWVGKLVLKF